jgi:U3 small nucleolar RNA-associated protein 6
MGTGGERACVCGSLVQDEVKAIVKKRRDFEFLLRRRTCRKADFLRYIEYELNLEELRRLRKVGCSQMSSRGVLSSKWWRRIRLDRGPLMMKGSPDASE